MRRYEQKGPSPNEIKLKGELDRIRRQLLKLQKEGRLDPELAASAVDPAAIAPAEVSGVMRSEDEETALQQKVADLLRDKRRLSKLYFDQLEENRNRQQKLRQILDNVSEINSEIDLDSLLQRLCNTVQTCLGFRVVLIRLREPGTRMLKARAFTGVDDAGRAGLMAADVPVEDLLSWLRDEFKVSRSYFISHTHDLNRSLPRGYRAQLGPREEWEWHEDDVLLTPLFSRDGELLAYISVDDPGDRLVPSREVVELLEIFGNHAAVAIENARLYGELENYARELQNASRHVQEMHTLKSNFLSAVSHELRTPLTAIRASVDTLMAAREGEIAHEQLHRFLAILDEESQRLARLIESVLDLNRFDSGTLRHARQTVDLAELLDETARMLEPAAQIGQVALKVHRDAADTRVEANRDQMRQLALHLASNAVKFTPPGGSVILRAAGDDREVTLQVEDTGIGIPEQSLERIFERFYQVDSSLVRRYGGAGLGLAICKSIAEWHGGKIEAQSAPGRGSTFTTTLPRRSSPRVMARPGSEKNGATGEILRLAIEMVAEVMNAGVVSVLAPEPDGTLVIRAAIGLDEAVVREARIRPGTGVAGWVVENRRPVCVSGAETRAEVEGSGRGLYRSRTFLSVPLEGESGLLGVLNVTDPLSQKPFAAEDCHVLLHLADRMATAWEQTLKPERNRVGAVKSAEVLRDLMKPGEPALARETSRARLARSLAREIGVSESQIGVISFATTLEEAAEGGAHRDPDTASRTPVTSMEGAGAVGEVTRSRFEWWDGTGFPQGLAGTAIPLGGRVLAVVEAWESLTQGRHGEPARSREGSLEELRRLKNLQFDPEIVDAFERVLARNGREVASDQPPAHEAETTDARR